MRRSEIPVVLFLLVAIFCLLSLMNNSNHHVSQDLPMKLDPRVSAQFNEWKECMMKNISAYENDARGLWGNLWKGVKLCEKLPFMVDLKIEDFHNSDETKRHIPSKQAEPSVIVTLGIGQDTRAEEALRKVLPLGSLFYGADPIQDVNEQLYSKFGTYFPFAVGAYSKISKASVLINTSYVDRTVVHIDLVYFLNDIIGRKVYDDLWIDAEGAEYDMFPYFYKGGKLDQYDITLCQFNLEVHDPDDEKKEMFRKFIFEILKDGRYAFFRPVQGRHIRLYFLNFVNPHCVSKYIFRSPIVDQFGKF